MIITEEALRGQLRRPHPGATVHVPPGSTLSPSARDFVDHWQLRTVEVPAPPPEWDRPSVFPVVLEGELPRCDQCHSPVRDKPDGLTQLSATAYAAKTHPRIRLRGRIDSLQAQALLCSARAGADGAESLREDLGTVAAYCRELMSAEYHEREAQPPALPGLDEEEIHAATHDPRGRLGIDHLTPGTADPELLHWLNLLRCQVREVELEALDVLGDGPAWGPSVAHGLNRLSSLVYYLELRLQASGANASTGPADHAGPEGRPT